MVSGLALPKMTHTANVGLTEKRGGASSDAALYGPVDWKKARGEDSSDAALYGPVDWKKSRDEAATEAA